MVWAIVNHPPLYHSLHDYLSATALTHDGEFDDGWGAPVSLKGRELDASVLFCDIAGFSMRTHGMSPSAILAFVNLFFTWISAEALQARPGIVDKYIGDEIMVVFSKEFGSEDPFLDAVQTARWMAQNDCLAYCPHIGIASGRVIAGYVGTPRKYDCSVFGTPVALAARCASHRPQCDLRYSRCIVFPDSDWGTRDFALAFPPRRFRMPDGTVEEREHDWELLPPELATPKNLPEISLRAAVNKVFWRPSFSVEAHASELAQRAAR